MGEVIENRKCFDGLEYAEISKAFIRLDACDERLEICEARRSLCASDLEYCREIMTTVLEADGVSSEAEKRKSRALAVLAIVGAMTATAFGAVLIAR